MTALVRPPVDGFIVPTRSFGKDSNGNLILFGILEDLIANNTPQALETCTCTWLFGQEGTYLVRQTLEGPSGVITELPPETVNLSGIRKLCLITEIKGAPINEFGNYRFVVYVNDVEIARFPFLVIAGSVK